jgi:hypothetical protein
MRRTLRIYSDEHSENPKRGIETTLETRPRWEYMPR